MRSVLLLAVLAGCVVDEVEAWLPADLDVSQPLERLGDEGYKLLCRSFDGHIHDIYRSQLLIKAACTAHALETTADAADCAARTDECLDTLPPVVEQQLDQIVAQAGCTDALATTTTCRSPVSELIQCLRDLRGIVESTGQELTCAAFGSPLPEDWWHFSTPLSCVALATSCPSGDRGH